MQKQTSNPTGETLVQDLCTSLDSIFKKQSARPFSQNMPIGKPPSISPVSATPKANPANAPSAPISKRFPLAFNKG